MTSLGFECLADMSKAVEAAQKIAARKKLEGQNMALVIAFIGYNEKLTRQFFDEFAWDNREQITSADFIRGRVKLYDGTRIVRIDASDIGRDGYRFDQIIVADDWRRDTYVNRNAEIMWLIHQCACSSIPEEFRFQFYDVDEGR